MNVNLATLDKEAHLLVTEIMTSAFNYDTATYFGEGVTDGPPGYADGTLTQNILNNLVLTTFFITFNQVKVGFITLDLEKRELAYFCLLPEYIRRGIGSQTWQIIQFRYGSDNWQLETPAYSTSNHHFYEKLGFIKVGERQYSNGAQSYCYKK